LIHRLEPEPLLAALFDHEVEFIVIGGFAVAAHGFPRATKDIDICPEGSDSNLRRLADALEELEAEPVGLDEFGEEFDLKPNIEGLRAGGNWILMTRFGRLDVMQHLQGVGNGGGGWADLRPRAQLRSFLGHDCLFCGYDDLLAMKTAADRDQDRVDVRTLRAQRHDLSG